MDNMDDSAPTKRARPQGVGARSAPTPRPFRIVHLSDLHLTARDDAPRSEPRLLSKLQGMNAAFRRLAFSRTVQQSDLVVVTGDITDRSAPTAWHQFGDTLRDAGLVARTLVVPGNHDTCCLGVRMPGPRVGYAAADLAKAVAGLRSCGQQTAYPWAQQRDERVVLFGLNSNNLGNFSAVDNALGTIGYRQLARLARLMAQFSHVPIKIVLLHHSPNIPGRRTEVSRGLEATTSLERLGHQLPREQRQALRLLCISQGVRLIAHGHLHRREDRRVDGVRIIGVSASTEPGPARQYEFAQYTVRGAPPRVFVKWCTVSAV